MPSALNNSRASSKRCSTRNTSIAERSATSSTSITGTGDNSVPSSEAGGQSGNWGPEDDEDYYGLGAC